MGSEPIKLRVSDVVLTVPASAGIEAGMVVLTEDQSPGRSLRIIIGQPEARAIHSAWDGSIPSRPSTWDLFVSAVALLGGSVDRAVITGVEQERHFFARLEVVQAGERRTLSCRPSDAVALALRSYTAGIYADQEVLDEVGVLPDGTRPGRAGAAVAAEPDATTGARAQDLALREAAIAAKERELAAREAALADPARDADPHEGGASPGEGASS